MWISNNDGCKDRHLSRNGKYVILMDEMHIKEGIVYDEHTGNFSS